VVEGMAVVDAISGVKTGTRGRFRDVPTDPILIIKAVRLQ
jgi:cyclophilin family peptidyl-prolyl cis-trans isomerase